MLFPHAPCEEVLQVGVEAIGSRGARPPVTVTVPDHRQQTVDFLIANGGDGALRPFGAVVQHHGLRCQRGLVAVTADLFVLDVGVNTRAKRI